VAPSKGVLTEFVSPAQMPDCCRGWSALGWNFVLVDDLDLRGRPR
jgi:hypothetical protein